MWHMADCDEKSLWGDKHQRWATYCSAGCAKDARAQKARSRRAAERRSDAKDRPGGGDERAWGKGTGRHRPRRGRRARRELTLGDFHRLDWSEQRRLAATLADAEEDDAEDGMERHETEAVFGESLEQ